jgi:hypothetical protein
VNRSFQFRDATEGSAADAFAGDLSKPTLDLVQALFAKEAYAPERNAVVAAPGAQQLDATPDEVPHQYLFRIPPRANLTGNEARMDIWFGRKQEVLIDFRRPLSLSFFCQNPANWKSTDIKRFDERVRRMPKSESWRQEKQEIGHSVVEIFEQIPEVSQIYALARGAVSDDNERLVLTFRCPKEMLACPFEFISSFSSVDEAQAHLALTHPLRKRILGYSCRKDPISLSDGESGALRVLLVSCNASGTFTVNRRRFVAPEIPHAEEEVECIRALFEAARQQGDVHLEVDTEVDPSVERMGQLLERGHYHLVHFSGHGFYGDSPDDSCLLFPTSNGGVERLTAGRLNELTHRSPVRFFYLSCCEGAVAATPEEALSSDFLGITDALLTSGLPTIIAMRWPIDDRSAKTLAGAFYRELLAGCSVETRSANR